MRQLREAAASNADARLAIQMFCYSVAKQVAAMIAALRGVDVIVFTGGIGENDAQARASICGALAWMGIRIDDARNDPPPISSAMPHRVAWCGYSSLRKTIRSRGIPGN
jgi:acetate kinase